jgi:putative mRNA 3-end processing factor
MDKKIKIQFLGGSSEVGRLGMLLETDGLRMLFDYGLSPGKPPSYPLEAPPIDLAFLSHSHLDHSGMIPYLCSRSETQVVSTDLTKEISQILQIDSIKVAKMEGYPVPYSKSDIRASRNSYIDVEPSQIEDVAGTEIHFHSAGHIPGSLMFELKGTNDILFTGDLNVINTHLLWGAHPVKCDILFLEATYAGRDHPNREELEKEFLDKIDEVVSSGGIVIAPAFAVARTQELLLVLDNAGYDVWLDGMGKKISKIFLEYPQYLRSEKRLRRALENVNVVYSNYGRKLALKGEVILTTSGMLDGGPVLWYINRLKEDPRSAIFLTGYQVEGTNGRRLLDKGKIDLYGVIEKVKCRVEYFDFSAHAGHSQLIEFAKACEPEKIVLFHSDDRTPLIKPLSEFAEVYTPNDKEILEI